MKNQKLLSIIIPTWNTSAITLKCVQTILKYLPKDLLQIIIVDNGSTDDSQAVLSPLKDILYIRNSHNLGFSKANNIGVAKASGTYFLFLNSDMELIDKSLLKMLDYLRSHPDIGLIGPKFLNPDLTPQASVFPPQTPLNAFKEYWLNIKDSYSKYTPTASQPISVHHISGGAVLISRTDFDRIGGWDEKYYFFYEDHELCRRIHNIGKLVFYYPRCRVIHRHGASVKLDPDTANHWRRLIPGSKIYHGLLVHYLIFIIIWSSQKIKNTFR